jgi:S-adenosylmethionine synthetase
VPLIVEELRTPVGDARTFEVVERKGLGHPDTICDAIAEEFSRGLCRFYLEHCGAILHHNVDKALLCGGRARPAFGGGEVIEPLELLLSGRATTEFRGVKIPVEEIADEAARSWLRAHLHALDPERHARVRCLVRPGSVELVELFARQLETGVPLANDTSLGVGFAPLSTLEQLVLRVERELNSPAVKGMHPQIGEDIKLMGVRQGDRIELTVACALVDRHVRSLTEYRLSIEQVEALALEAARGVTTTPVSVAVNTGDDLEAGNVYLTVTGTSAEAGDDGEVGRGNRANGLITPFRPMTLEAAAGKNPVTHVGKLYNALAGRIATRLVERIEGITAAQCCLVSQIGRPITDPAVQEVAVTTRDGLSLDDVEAPLEALVREELAGSPGLWREIIEGAIPFV